MSDESFKRDHLGVAKANERGFLKTEATVEYQTDLAEKLTQTYPIVDSKATLSHLQDRDITYAGFSLTAPGQLKREIILTALERAGDPSDPAFCEHGAQHTVFNWTLSVLTQNIQDGAPVKQFYREMVISYGDDYKKKAKGHRLILEGPEVDRATRRPKPQQFAEELTAREIKNPKMLTRYIRDAAKEYHLPFAILGAIYYGQNPQQVLEILDNREFRNQMKEKWGRSTRVPHHSEIHTVLPNLMKLYRTLTIESTSGIHITRSADAFNEAVELMSQMNFGPITEDLDFMVLNRKVIPRAVFKGMTEVAQESASDDFADPAKTMHIFDRYGRYATTHMITAYLDEDVTQDQPTFYGHIYNPRKKTGTGTESE